MKVFFDLQLRKVIVTDIAADIKEVKGTATIN